MPATTSRAQNRVAIGQVALVGLIAAVVAVVGDVIIYSLALSVGVSMFMPAQPGQPAAVLRIEMVITAAILGALVGTIVFAVLGFISTNGRRFAIVGIVFLLITLAAPLNLAIGHAADGQTVATLILMHVVAGGSIIGLLSRLGRRRAKFASDAGAANRPS